MEKQHAARCSTPDAVAAQKDERPASELRPTPENFPGAPPDGRAKTRFGMCHPELSVAIQLRGYLRHRLLCTQGLFCLAIQVFPTLPLIEWING